MKFDVSLDNAIDFFIIFFHAETDLTKLDEVEQSCVLY